MNWGGRPVILSSGTWAEIRSQLSTFYKSPYSLEKAGKANPYFQSIVRVASNGLPELPVGLVSKKYALVQHEEIVNACLAVLKKEWGIETEALDCEIEQTEHGEKAHCSIFLPEKYALQFDSEDDRLLLRLEIYNSVDGFNRLQVLLGWYRFICSNGMVIAESLVSFESIHDHRLLISKVGDVLQAEMTSLTRQIEVIRRWKKQKVSRDGLINWCDTILAEKWGKKAACRTFHICTCGSDVEYKRPFEKALPTKKSVQRSRRVLGQPDIAKSRYDVSQALSWLATNQANVSMKLRKQSEIRFLVERLAS